MNKTVIPVDNILGTAEVADVLGVSKQRIANLRKLAEFPDPVVHLASTPLWDRSDILDFLTIWRPWKVLNNEE
jgi:predicted DNA-binding transcriptional regulator AlpA